jgi:lysophospholipid acyltransferase (LPLAT)-like uncharacterized protein
VALGSRLGALAIGILGRTLRWEVEGAAHLDQIHAAGRRAIFTFWHGRIFPATWYWRQRSIVVMTSLNRDGEVIARCIRRHGFLAARGSSSRAGFRALAEMARSIRSGLDAAFTVDGPRGPRWVAKPGPVILARKTGAGILCFHISLGRKFELGSWDGFQIPFPFSRARVLIAPPLWVAPDADEAAVREAQTRMQQTLDTLRRRGEDWERGDEGSGPGL